MPILRGLGCNSCTSTSKYYGDHSSLPWEQSSGHTFKLFGLTTRTALPQYRLAHGEHISSRLCVVLVGSTGSERARPLCQSYHRRHSSTTCWESVKTRRSEAMSGRFFFPLRKAFHNKGSRSLTTAAHPRLDRNDTNASKEEVSNPSFTHPARSPRPLLSDPSPLFSCRPSFGFHSFVSHFSFLDSPPHPTLLMVIASPVSSSPALLATSPERSRAGRAVLPDPPWSAPAFPHSASKCHPTYPPT
jgi:hypothetical protein